MTGPEFATSHGNDSSTWTSADFETAEHLAEIDLQPALALLPRKTPTRRHLNGITIRPAIHHSA